MGSAVSVAPPEQSACETASTSGAQIIPDQDSRDDASIAVALSFDDRLAEVLGSGDIALVRSAWLLAQPEDYRIVRRQDLQPLGALSPLLEPDEAVRLLRKGRRNVGALTYGWPTAGNADPTGHRARLLRRALRERPDIEAIFWDFPSLFQHPRTEVQERKFKNGLGVVSKPSHRCAPCT